RVLSSAEPRRRGGTCVTSGSSAPQVAPVRARPTGDWPPGGRAVRSSGQGGDDVADLVGGQRARGVTDRELYPLHARVAGGHGLRPDPDPLLGRQLPGGRGEPARPG